MVVGVIGMALTHGVLPSVKHSDTNSGDLERKPGVILGVSLSKPLTRVLGPAGAFKQKITVSRFCRSIRLIERVFWSFYSTELDQICTIGSLFHGHTTYCRTRCYAKPYIPAQMMFRLQSNWPARHDMLNGDAVILHNALHN